MLDMAHSKTFIAIPPGATIKEQLDYRGMQQKDFALRMALSEKHIINLMKGRVELTPQVALRLEMVLGIPATFWENLEAIYRSKLLKVEEENQLETEFDIAKKLPCNEMNKFGWIFLQKNNYDNVVTLRKFFEVSTLKLISNPQINKIACRRFSDSEKSNYALLAWAQKARLLARDIPTQSINLTKLKRSISTLRKLNTMSPEKFCSELVTFLAKVGVALVFLPHLKGSTLHGASFYDGKKIVIGMTVRGKDADKFWFSFFHEIAHVIYGHIGKLEGTTEEDEKQANDFAAETLIPSSVLQKFTANNSYTAQSLTQFAQKIGVDVGILVGRLQHEKIIDFNQFNHLKKQYILTQSDETFNGMEV